MTTNLLLIEVVFFMKRDSQTSTFSKFFVEAPEDEQQEERSHSTVAVEATAEGEALP